MGLALRQLRRYEDAEWAYRGGLAALPLSAGLYNNLGNVLRDQERHAESLEAFNRALELDENFVGAWFNRGSALSALGYEDARKTAFLKALELQPEYVDAMVNLANCYLEEGDHETAHDWFTRALEINPQHRVAQANLARLLERQNRLDEAVAHLQKVEAEAYHDANVALAYARVMRRRGDPEAARAALEDSPIIADAERSGQRVERAYILGEIHDQLGNADQAIPYFQEGNARAQHNPAALRFSKQEYLDNLEHMLNTFTAPWVKSWQPVTYPENDGNAPVFLIGYPRSGTTLLDTIMRSHPEIQVIEERRTAEQLLPPLQESQQGSPHAAASLGDGDIRQLRNLYRRAISQTVDLDQGGVVIDKLPLRTIYAGILHRIFPEAKFLVALRHPCDCVLSGYMQNFRPNNAMSNFYSLADAAHLYDRVMTLWKRYTEILPIKWHTLRYEDLIGDFDGTVGPALHFLGLDWHEDVTNYRETARQRGTIRTPSDRQVIQPLYQTAKYRWVRYAHHMEHVLPTLIPWARYWGYPDPEGLDLSWIDAKQPAKENA